MQNSSVITTLYLDVCTSASLFESELDPDPLDWLAKAGLGRFAADYKECIHNVLDTSALEHFFSFFFVSSVTSV